MPMTVVVALSIPDELLERIDREAKRRGMGRDEFILNAVRAG
jgi:metal-responsive CopG/Arc/MetJ family transcriptional regulator